MTKFRLVNALIAAGVFSAIVAMFFSQVFAGLVFLAFFYALIYLTVSSLRRNGFESTKPVAPRLVRDEEQDS